MIKVYWKSPFRQKASILLIAITSLFLYVIVELFQIDKEQPHYKEKLIAAKLAEKAFKRIHLENVKNNRMASKDFDPTESGLIGANLSEVTSNVGYISSKQTSINPNFAAVTVHLLHKAKVQPGDSVAIALSGSFPAINIAVYSAIQTMKLNPIVICSVSSSQWGANYSDFLWLDMESLLIKEKILTTKSKSATLGGVDDLALGMTEKSKNLLKNSILRNNVSILEFSNFADGIDKRMALYNSVKKTDVKAYINIGGGSVSVGTSIGKKAYKPGLNRSIPFEAEEIDSVMLRFLKDGIPVIHFTQIESLAKKYNLPISPKVPPKPGEGNLFKKTEYNPWIVALSLIIILLSLFFLQKKVVNDSEIIL
jgi:poly-gamma-glutamate system protein